MRWGFVDLYCGGGGLSTGATYAGGVHIAGLDNDHDSGALLHYNLNFNNPVDLNEGFDLSHSPSKYLQSLIPKEMPWILIGGPPCKSFSIAGLEKPDDERSKHIQNFVNAVADLRPDGFLFENVPNLFGMRNQRPKDWEKKLEQHERFVVLKKFIEKIGYTVSAHVLLASEYGTPQNRIRVVVFGTKNGSKVQFPEPTHYVVGKSEKKYKNLKKANTVEDAIGDIVQGLSKKTTSYVSNAKTDFQKWARLNSKSLSGHLPTDHDAKILALMKEQPVGEGLYDFNHSWIKFDPKKPSKTIKMNNRAPGVHWERCSSLSPRECARLQGFPDTFTLTGTKTQMLNVIGNAVPPQLGEAAVNALIQAIGLQ